MMDGDGPMPGLLTTAFRDAGLAVEAGENGPRPVHSTARDLGRLPEELILHPPPSGRRACSARFDEWAGGTARFERATDLAGLEEGKRVLTALHHARWEGGGRTGVFRSPLFLDFHDAMMRHLLERGALELTWLTVRGEPMAALYGMRWGEKVDGVPDGPAAGCAGERAARRGDPGLRHSPPPSRRAGASSICWPTRRPTRCSWPRRCGRWFRFAWCDRGRESPCVG